MKTFRKQISLLGAIITTTFCMNAFADNTPAQLDTTPPPPEAALTADQTPPITAPGGSTLATPSSGAGSLSAPSH